MQRPWESAAYCFALHGLFNLLSGSTQITSSGEVPPTGGWAFPHQSLLTKCPEGLPTVKSYEGIFSTEAPSSLMTLVYVKLT